MEPSCSPPTTNEFDAIILDHQICSHKRHHYKQRAHLQKKKEKRKRERGDCGLHDQDMVMPGAHP